MNLYKYIFIYNKYLILYIFCTRNLLGGNREAFSQELIIPDFWGMTFLGINAPCNITESFFLTGGNRYYLWLWMSIRLGFPGGSMVKTPPANAKDSGDSGSIPGSTPVFLPVKSQDRGAWWATVMGSQRVRQDWSTEYTLMSIRSTWLIVLFRSSLHSLTFSELVLLVTHGGMPNRGFLSFSFQLCWFWLHASRNS